jgi:hypothetical protein
MLNMSFVPHMSKIKIHFNVVRLQHIVLVYETYHKRVLHPLLAGMIVALEAKKNETIKLWYSLSIESILFLPRCQLFHQGEEAAMKPMLFYRSSIITLP